MWSTSAMSASENSAPAAYSTLALAGRIEAKRKARLPTTALVASTERIKAMAARLRATMTMSAINSTTPPWRRGGILTLGARSAIRIGFMLERIPGFVAHRYHGFVDPVAVVAADGGKRTFVATVGVASEQCPGHGGRFPVPLLAADDDADAYGLQRLELRDQVGAGHPQPICR